MEKIKCNNPSEIEGWPRGDPEFFITAVVGENVVMEKSRFDMTGTETTFNRPITYWRPKDWMETANFKLIEIDGEGEGKAFTLSLGYNQKIGDDITLSSSVGITIKSSDVNEDCGQFTASFFDNERYYMCNGLGGVEVYLK